MPPNHLGRSHFPTFLITTTLLTTFSNSRGARGKFWLWILCVMGPTKSFTLRPHWISHFANLRNNYFYRTYFLKIFCVVIIPPLLSDSGWPQPDVRSSEGGPVCCPRELSGLVQRIYCTESIGLILIALFWQRYCENSARPSIPIGIPSQIAVDCKSVHLSPFGRLFKKGVYNISHFPVH